MRKHIAHALSALVLLSGLAATTTGCSDHDIIDPAIEVPKDCSVVVVPFKDEDSESGFESQLGQDLARKVTAIFKTKDEFRVKSLRAVLDKLYQDGNADPAKLTVKEVANLTKADYVVTGTIVRWALHDEKMFSPDVLRGTSIVSVTIYETARATALRLGDKADKDEIVAGHGINAVEERPVNALFPHDFGMGDFGSYTLTKDEVELGLRNATALHISWLLLSHTKDEEKLTGAR
jgi:TolB-like protein